MWLFGGWHQVALELFRKLGSALARHTGQEEGEQIEVDGLKLLYHALWYLFCTRI